MVCVFPGCPEVLAKDFLFTRALMRDDFPTFDLPANATSGNVFLGSLLVIPHTVSKFTFFITMFFLLSLTF